MMGQPRGFQKTKRLPKQVSMISDTSQGKEKEFILHQARI